MAVLVGKPAPDFNVAAVLGNGEIVDSYCFSEASKGKYALVFFWPLDFTFVCPSEIIALDNKIEEFKARNVEVVGVSIDSQFTHNAWRNTPVNAGGIGPVKFTMAADTRQDIVRAYDVQSAGGVAFRGAFIIDKDGIVRSQIINDLPLGRNIDEIIRIVDALQFTEQHGEVCPANWQKGDKGMTATPAGVASYLSEHATAL
ncbi:alkyl hydroperoxide reductase [Alkanindiges hydrocarboniclasticus]|jgi:peroxiredoxin (alkyl hydroperoxide reductase subunit C)|uniref:Thioredoxin peroxidase n=2 Tax=Bacteria TaxID=2 RepID=A0A1S8CUM3_9GAMM|nr:redoxin domain-containing protein [Alkanindiges hydrocarboniclasticus]ONG39856.1 alkyl hydroperoxide reductase [Alkanindiges hydrocarboniclasticus]